MIKDRSQEDTFFAEAKKVLDLKDSGEFDTFPLDKQRGLMNGLAVQATTESHNKALWQILARLQLSK